MFAHKDGVVPRPGKNGRITRAGDARFGHTHHTSGHLWSHAHCPICIDGEGHEVSLIHADQIGASGDSPIEFSFVMDLDKRIEPNRTGQLQERFEFGLVKRGRDEQHAVGAHNAGIANIASTDSEVFT